jgi:hypothetical protein
VARDNIARHMLGDTPRQRNERPAAPSKLEQDASAPDSPTPPPVATGGGKEQTVVKLVGPLAGELKNAVWWLRQHVNPAATVAGIVEEAVRRQLTDLKQHYNDDQDFPPRTGELPRGRPIVS